MTAQVKSYRGLDNPIPASERPREPAERDPAREAHLANIRAGSRWLDADEAAAYIKRSVKTVQNLTSSARLHPRYIDRRPLYDRRELDAVVAGAPCAPPQSTTEKPKKEKKPRKSQREPVEAT